MRVQLGLPPQLPITGVDREQVRSSLGANVDGARARVNERAGTRDNLGHSWLTGYGTAEIIGQDVLLPEQLAIVGVEGIDIAAPVREVERAGDHGGPCRDIAMGSECPLGQ